MARGAFERRDSVLDRAGAVRNRPARNIPQRLVNLVCGGVASGRLQNLHRLARCCRKGLTAPEHDPVRVFQLPPDALLPEESVQLVLEKLLASAVMLQRAPQRLCYV